jgi:GC-rich sequence DNA-binding factor
MKIWNYFLVFHTKFWFLWGFVVDRISKESSKVFEDVLESFYSIDCIKSQFEAWRSKYYMSYKDAYIGLCLPKLFNPLIRLQLLTWTPLEVGCFYYC